MIQLSETQAAVIGKLLGKLTERSSIASYLVAVLALVGVNDHGVAEQIAGYLGLAASLLLLILNDKTVHSVFVRAPTPIVAPVAVMEPVAVELPASTLSQHPSTAENIMSFSISSIFDRLKAVAALLPIATQLVQSIEHALPSGTPGAAKLKAVEDALRSVYEKEQLAEASFGEIWPLISGVVTTLVATFKATGAFKSSAAQAPSA